MANVSIIDQELFHIPNYLLLLFKYYLYVSKCSKTISFIALKTYIKKTYIRKSKIFYTTKAMFIFINKLSSHTGNIVKLQ